MRPFLVGCFTAFVALMQSTASAAPDVAPNPLLPPAAARVVLLRGTITSTGSTPVAGAEVRLLRNGSVVANTLADKNGTYRFTDVTPGSGEPPIIAPGTYALEAQYRGSTKSAGTVAIRAGSTARRDVALGGIKKAGGASFVPRSTLSVTDRTVGSTPSSVDGAFSNERPILACAPTPDCALHYDVTDLAGPLFAPPAPLADLDAFVDRMHSEYPAATTVTLYVHGFNNTFGDTLRLTAESVASIDQTAVPVLYSWPSKHETARYIDDESSNAWASEHFTDFVVALLQHPRGPATVNILAHSMGNRIVVAALRYIARAKPAMHGRIGQVVFAAPDIDATTFWEGVPAMAMAAQGLTVYGSHHDEALQLSRQLHGHCRAGLFDCNDQFSLPATVNEIDASYFRCDLIGHGYWAASTTVLGDIGAVFSHGPMQPGTPPRTFITPLTDGAGKPTPGRYRFSAAAPTDEACEAQPLV